ncbi:haloacid dehalogenase type II [Paenibacillus tarimensis]
MVRVQTVVFDAYGTLFDVHSVVEKLDHFFPGKGQEVSDVWRQKQLEYTWLRSLMGRYKNFWYVTDDALVYALKSLGLHADAATRRMVLSEYVYLKPFPEVPSLLNRIQGMPLAILSNGTPQMLHSVVNHAGLGHYFSAILSVDVIRIYKPYMGVYQLAPANLGFRREEILYVSGNAWDAAGAKTYGLTVCWVNRTNTVFDELDVRPDLIVRDLSQLADVLRP